MKYFILLVCITAILARKSQVQTALNANLNDPVDTTMPPPPPPQCPDGMVWEDCMNSSPDDGCVEECRCPQGMQEDAMGVCVAFGDGMGTGSGTATATATATAILASLNNPADTTMPDGTVPPPPSQGSDQCTNGMVWEDCMNSSPDDVCVQECRCPQGMQEDAMGVCVASGTDTATLLASLNDAAGSDTQAPAQECTNGMVWEDCSNNSATDGCVQECRCTDGMQMNEDGVCVAGPPPAQGSQGPQECTNGMVWEDCSNNSATDGCIQECRCTDGMQMNEDGVCVAGPPPAQGPQGPAQECTNGMVWEDCSNNSATDGCVQECRCAEGMQMNEDGVCVAGPPPAF